jgi:hypothetical protein
MARTIRYTPGRWRSFPRTFTQSGGAFNATLSQTFHASGSGLYYLEMTYNAIVNPGPMYGFALSTHYGLGIFPGDNNASIGLAETGSYFINGSPTSSGIGAAFSQRCGLHRDRLG